jgi:CRP-like cAMP-binding protein
MYKDLTKGIKAFEKRGKKFIAAIGPLLRKVKFGAHEAIYSENEYANEIYFIKSGSITFVLEEFENFPFMNIYEGYYFGEIDILLSQTRKMKVITQTPVEILVLNAEDFNKVFIKEFPAIGKWFYNRMFTRRIKQIKARDRALDYCDELRKMTANLRRCPSEIKNLQAQSLNPDIDKSYMKSTSETSDMSPLFPLSPLYSIRGSPFQTDERIIEKNKEMFGMNLNQPYSPFSSPGNKSITGEDLFDKNQTSQEDEDKLMDKVDAWVETVNSQEKILDGIMGNFEQFLADVGFEDLTDKVAETEVESKGPVGPGWVGSCGDFGKGSVRGKISLFGVKAGTGKRPGGRKTSLNNLADLGVGAGEGVDGRKGAGSSNTRWSVVSLAGIKRMDESEIISPQPPTSS